MRKSYFDGMYASSEDPWGFDSSWYEARKFALTMAALPERRYRRAFEPGCANGTLTEMLATRCDEVFAYDFVEATVERARRRLASQTGVRVDTGRFPEDWPDGELDLVVWSEIAYYLDHSGRDVAAASLSDRLASGGTLISVHYTGETNYPMHGSDVMHWLDDLPMLEKRSHLEDERFELAVWTRSND